MIEISNPAALGPLRRQNSARQFTSRSPVQASDRTAIAAQAHREAEECRGNRQADPQTGTAQKFSEVEVSQHHDAAAHPFILRTAADTRRQHGAEMRSVEDNLLDDA